MGENTTVVIRFLWGKFILRWDFLTSVKIIMELHQPKPRWRGLLANWIGKHPIKNSLKVKVRWTLGNETFGILFSSVFFLFLKKSELHREHHTWVVCQFSVPLVSLCLSLHLHFKCVRLDKTSCRSTLAWIVQLHQHSLCCLSVCWHARELYLTSNLGWVNQRTC